MTRAVAYCRVSTNEQVLGTSLDTQRERCARRIEMEPEWEPVGEFVDEGESGAKANRPELDRLVALCQAGAVDVVVVAKLDRLGRSMRHLSDLIGRLDDWKVQLVSVAESFDSGTPSGRLQRSMLGSFAEFEREQIIERTSAGLRATARAGNWPGGPPPYGYRLDRTTAPNTPPWSWTTPRRRCCARRSR